MGAVVEKGEISAAEGVTPSDGGTFEADLSCKFKADFVSSDIAWFSLKGGGNRPLDSPQQNWGLFYSPNFRRHIDAKLLRGVDDIKLNSKTQQRREFQIPPHPLLVTAPPGRLHFR